MLKISQAHSPTLRKSQGNFNAVIRKRIISLPSEDSLFAAMSAIYFSSLYLARLYDDKSYKRSGPLKILTSNFAPKLAKFKEEPTRINYSIFARRTRFLNSRRPQEALKLDKSRRR